MARNLVRFDPFAELSVLQNRLLSDGLFSRPRNAPIATTDIYTEDDKQLVVEAHLPNFDQDDIAITVDQGALVIQGEKRERDEDKDKKYVVRESSSSFYRRIVLPEQADDSQVSATFTDGVLRVTVPFVELPKPTTVPITSDAAKPAVGASTST